MNLQSPIVVLGAVLLTACVNLASTGGPSSTAPRNGGLSIAPPSGYCVDQTAGRESGDSAIVMIGRCRAASKVKPALVTVSIGEQGSANVLAAGNADLVEYFTSSAGRATLSRQGRGADLRVIEVLSTKGALLMHLREPAGPGYWRAMLGLRNRLVSVSVQGATEADLTPDDSRAILDRTLAALRRAN